MVCHISAQQVSSPNGLLFSFDTMTRTKRPHSPLSGVGGVPSIAIFDVIKMTKFRILWVLYGLFRVYL